MVNVSGITSGVRAIWNYGKRALEVAPELAFGTASAKAGSAMKAAQGSLFNKAQAGWHALEKAGSGNFFQGFWTNCKKFFPDARDAFKSGSGIKDKFGKLFKNLGTKMSFLMAASWMLFEVPNVFTAIKEKGLFQGAKEVLKFGVRMTTAGLGAAIGAASPIPGGSLIGWFVGDWLASKIVGKRYTDQKEEQEQMIKELTGQTEDTSSEQVEQKQQGQEVNPYWLNNQTANASQQTSFNGNMSNLFDYNQYKLQSMPYADDIMMKNMNFNAVA